MPAKSAFHNQKRVFSTTFKKQWDLCVSKVRSAWISWMALVFWECSLEGSSTGSTSVLCFSDVTDGDDEIQTTISSISTPQILNEQSKLPFWPPPEVCPGLSPAPSQLPLSQLVMNLREMESVGPCLPPSQNQTAGGFPALTLELNFLPFSTCSSHLVDHPSLRYEKYVFYKYEKKKKKRKIGSWKLSVL